MQLTFDPVWPWSSLLAYLASAAPSVIAAAFMVGVIVCCLPVVLHLRPGGATPRQLLRGAALALGFLLVWGLVSGAGSGGFLNRLHGLGMWALLAAPFALAGITIWTYLGVPGATSRRIGAILFFR